MKYQSSMSRILIDEVKQALQRDPNDRIFQAEEHYHRKIKRAAEQIISEHRRIILLTGPSSSGKTTTSKLLQTEISARGYQVHRISLDNFYRPHEELPRWNDGYINYESIDGLDIPYFNQLVSQLRQTGSADFPIFDFGISARSEKTFTVTMDEETFIIFEGIHALNPRLSEQFDPARIMKIYVSVHSDFIDQADRVLLGGRELRLLRRMLRDNVQRNATPVKTLELWDYVLRGEEEYIKPFKGYADFHINSTHAYEPFVYRDDTELELEPFTDDRKYGEVIRALLGKIKAFPAISKTLIPKDSLLKEFI